MMSSASAVAWTSSTARATMLRYGLRAISSASPVRPAPRPRADGAGRAASVTGPPARAGTARRRGRGPGARSTRPPAAPRTRLASRSARGRGRRSRRSGPRSSGTRRSGAGRRAGLALERRRLEAGDQVDRRAARSRAPPSSCIAERRDLVAPERRARSRRRGPRPGGSARPPIERDDLVAGLLEAGAPLDGGSVVLWPARARSGSRGSRAGGAGRRGARGSRSTRRSTAAGAARGPPGRPRCRAPSSNAWTAVIW